jgi:probable HAF family extracellular repeat protein
MNLRRGILGTGGLIALAISAPAATYYTVTDLGDFGYGSQAYGINSLGLVAGYAATSPTATLSFVYSGGTLYQVGTLPGGTSSNIFAINSASHPVGTSQVNGDTAHHAFELDGTGLIDLGTLPGGTNSTANDISETGLVVGLSEVTGGYNHAFGVYAEGMIDLGTFTGGNNSAAYGVNDVGDIVGTSETDTPGVYSAIVWAADGQKYNLGHLGGTPSRATSVNNHREVVGYSYLPGNLVYHGFYYYQTQIYDIGTLGGSNSEALDINNRGEVVGDSDIVGGTAIHAFVITDGGMRDLNALIPSYGWLLISATSINDSGQIVGYGVNPKGLARAFLLTPVSPPAVPPGAPPSVTVAGPKKRNVAASKAKIKGTAAGSVSTVRYRVGKGPWKNASGTGQWSFTAPLNPGKNTITIVAHGPDGDSTPAKISIKRK